MGGKWMDSNARQEKRFGVRMDCGNTTRTGVQHSGTLPRDRLLCLHNPHLLFGSFSILLLPLPPSSWSLLSLLFYMMLTHSRTLQHSHRSGNRQGNQQPQSSSERMSRPEPQTVEAFNKVSTCSSDWNRAQCPAGLAADVAPAHPSPGALQLPPTPPMEEMRMSIEVKSTAE